MFFEVVILGTWQLGSLVNENLNISLLLAAQTQNYVTLLTDFLIQVVAVALLLCKGTDWQMILNLHHVLVCYKVIYDVIVIVEWFREDSEYQETIVRVFTIDSSVVFSALCIASRNILFLYMQQLSLQLVRGKLFKFSSREGQVVVAIVILEFIPLHNQVQRGFTLIGLEHRENIRRVFSRDYHVVAVK